MIISSAEVLSHLKSSALPDSEIALIDVRSETEFAEGSLPGFVSLPILTQAERHQVGTAYKKQGQAQAIDLGYRLTSPHRSDRTQTWLKQLLQSAQKKAWVCCWRGGLRSQIATEWLNESLNENAGNYPALSTGACALRVHGGYKELRRHLLAALPAPHASILVLSGNTGSGKTRFLQQLQNSPQPAFPALDLEGLAKHRGSSFGGLWAQKQPSQATFENALGLALYQRTGELLVEDESICIGSLHLPKPFFDRMRVAARIVLTAPLDERVRTLKKEYVDEPLARGVSPSDLEARLTADLLALKKRLGGLQTDQLLQQLKRAFAQAQESPEKAEATESHQAWIQGLLEHYYDPMYEYGRAKQSTPPLFEGDVADCREFLFYRLNKSPHLL